MADREKVMEGLECCTHGVNKCAICPYDPRYNKIDDINARSCMTQLAMDALELLKAQEPRLMTLEEVMAQECGTVLWVEEAQNYVWNLFPLEVDLISTHPDTGTYYLFFIAYHNLKKFEGDEYGTVWRCWTSRPTDEQREATPWAE